HRGSVDVDREHRVPDDASDAGEDRDREDERDLPLRALGALRVGVGQAAPGRLQPGDLETLRDAGAPAVPAVLARVRRLLEAHEDLDPIQTAQPISAPSPTTNTQTPSDTGPSEPSDRPPGLVPRCSMRNAMMSRFSSGVRVASLKPGIDCGPVSIAS